MKQETCCVKVGPDSMPCAEPVEYLTAEQTGSQISGWYHHDRGQDHHAVPASYVR